MGRRDAVLNLRPYQLHALENLWTALQVELNILLVSPTGAGKTVIFSKIAQRLIAENPSFRVLILTDREILVSQSRDKLLRIAPELSLSVGIACASVSDTKTLHKPITIASRQSLTKHLGRFEPVNLIIVDEVHLAAVPKEGDTEPPDQFSEIIQTLKEYNPKTRLLGVTATPYRLTDGYIYGTKNAKGCLPYFSEVHHQITVAELQSQGFLAPLKGKTIVPNGLEDRLKAVSLVAGEYNIGSISNIMSEGIHIKSAVEAWKEHAPDRKKTLAFCTTIEHSEKLAAAFRMADIPALAIHSQLDDLESYARMQALKNGDAKVFTSVAKLTTGLDIEDIDAVLMCRPTKSAALYYQCIGRSMRIAEGKTDALILDLVGNNNEFGTDLDRLKVRYKKATDKDGKPMNKDCPNCESLLHIAVRVCPDCGYEYPRTDFEEADKPEMVDAQYGAQPPVELEVESWFPSLHKSKEKGRKLLRLRLEMENNTSGSLWMCFPEDGYTGFAVEKGKKLWTQLGGKGEYPKSADEAVERTDELLMPLKCLVDLNGKWPEIKEVREVMPF